MQIYDIMLMDKWTEIKAAYQVARLGTVSAAAEVLGVHRATVIRHIDALEAELGGTLFHRHNTGYTAIQAWYRRRKRRKGLSGSYPNSLFRKTFC